MTTEEIKKAMKALQNRGIQPDEILQKLTERGISVDIVLDSICEMQMFSREKLGDIKMFLRTVVKIPAHLKGYGYLATAILIYREGISITKELYPEVAKQHKVTSSQVERAIRNAIEVGYERNYEFFDPLGGRVHNSEFIATIAAMLDEQ